MTGKRGPSLGYFSCAFVHVYGHEGLPLTIILLFVFLIKVL